MSPLEELKPEKRQRILNAAMAEFSRLGFSRSSTNQIVKDAGISKGSLFQYFGDKESLFLGTFDFALGVLEEALRPDSVSGLPPFRRLEAYVFNMAELLYRYPDVFAFIEKAKNDSDPDIRGKARKRKESNMAGLMDEAFRGLEGPFPNPAVDAAFVRTTVLSVLTGLIERYLGKEVVEPDMESFRQAVADYLTRFERLVNTPG